MHGTSCENRRGSEREDTLKERGFPLSWNPILLLPFEVLIPPSPHTPGCLFMGDEGFMLYLALDSFMGSDFSSFFLLFFFLLTCLSFGY